MGLIADVYDDVLAASYATRKLEKECIVDNFVAAVKAINRLKVPKIGQIEKEVKSLNEHESEAAKVVANAGAVFLQMVQDIQGRQLGWAKALMKADTNLDPASISTSVRSLIEFEADRFLRAMVSAKDFGDSLESFKSESDGVMDGVKMSELLTTYVTLSGISTQEWADMGRFDGAKTVELAMGLVKESFIQTTKKLSEVKSKVVGSAIYQRQLKLQRSLDSFDEKEITSFLPTDESMTADEELMKLLRAGAASDFLNYVRACFMFSVLFMCRLQDLFCISHAIPTMLPKCGETSRFWFCFAHVVPRIVLFSA